MRPRSKRAPREIAPAAPMLRGAAAKRGGGTRLSRRSRPPIAPALNRPASIGARRCAVPDALNRRRAVSRRDDSPRRLWAPPFEFTRRFEERFGPAESKRGASAAVGRKRLGCARSRFFCRSNCYGAFSGALGAPRGFKEPSGLRIGLGVGFEVGFCRRRFASACGWLDRGNQHRLGLGHGHGHGLGFGRGRVGPRGSDGWDCGWGAMFGMAGRTGLRRRRIAFAIPRAAAKGD